MSDHKDVEKASYDGAHVTEGSIHAEGGAHMHRALKGRQVSMIAIAGTIGTGLFL
jgi:yeast amino acid transporter